MRRDTKQTQMNTLLFAFVLLIIICMVWSFLPLPRMHHSFVVEFHLYLYHLLDACGWDIQHIPYATNGFENLQMETVSVRIYTSGGVIERKISLPMVFNRVLQSYLSGSTEVTYFPQYEYHIMNRESQLHDAQLRTGVFSCVKLFGLNLNHDMSCINMIKWETQTTKSNYLLELSPSDWEPRGEISPAFQPVTEAGHVDLSYMFPQWRDQGDLGSCACVAVTRALEQRLQTPLSETFVYWTTRVLVYGESPANDCGADIPDVIRSIRNSGICSWSAHPYGPDGFQVRPSGAAFTQALHFNDVMFIPVQPHRDIIRRHLHLGHPLIADINFPPSAYATPTAKGKAHLRERMEEDPDGWHSILIVGFINDEYIVLNSYGDSWGDKGRCYLPGSYVQHMTNLYYVN